MNDVRAADYWDGQGLALLMSALLIAPLAWLVDLQTSYSLVKWACQQDRRWVLLTVPIVSLTAIAIGTWIGWWCFRQLHRGADIEGATTVDRSYLLALSALILNVFFGLLIITSLAPRYFLSPCAS